MSPSAGQPLVAVRRYQLGVPSVNYSDSNNKQVRFLNFQLKKQILDIKKSNKYAIIKNWSNQNPNPALETETGNYLNYK